jgi:hypothetical protein
MIRGRSKTRRPRLSPTCASRGADFLFAISTSTRHVCPGMNDDPGRNPPPQRASGRWFLVALGVLLALLGGVFVWLMGRSFLRAREMRTWPEVSCVILSSEIEERIHDPQSRPEYRQDLSFGYEWKGEPRTGDHLTLRGSPWSSRRNEVAKRVAEYPAGMRTTCRIDPAHPDFAVLKPDSLAPGYSIWFPALFVIGGLGIAIRALKTTKTDGR